MALFFSFSSHSPSLPLCWLFSEPNFLQAARSPATFISRTLIKYSSLGDSSTQNGLYRDKKIFYIGHYISLHFQFFYDCRLVGAGCRQVHVARRSRWLVFNEGAAGRQAGRQASRLGRRSRYQILSAISRQSQPAARYFNVKQGGLERGNWIVLKVAGKTSSRTTIKDIQRKG